MKIDFSKNSSRNIVTGVINKLVVLGLPFIIRTTIIYYLGEQYLGLSSLYTSILNVLNLAELGFNTAMVYSMYRPIAEDDKDSICALLALYRKIYRIVGLVVLFIGLAIIPFLRNLIYGNYPRNVNIYILYLIFLCNNVLGYFMYAYKSSLFIAHQRADITNNVATVIQLGSNILQVIMIVCTRNYYLYIIFTPIATVMSNITIGYLASKKFPEYQCRGKVSKEQLHEIRKKVLALITHKVGTVIQSSIDSITLSALVGLTVLAIYNNYVYISTAIKGFVSILFTSIVAGLGNRVHINSVEKNYKDFNKLLFVNAWVVGWCSICLFCLYQTFVFLWVGPKLMLSNRTVLLLVILFYVDNIRSSVGTYKDAIGMWWEDRFRPIAISISNLILTVGLGKVIGLDGIIFATIFSYLFVSMYWETDVLFRGYFNEPTHGYFAKQGKYFLATLGIGCVTYYISQIVHYDTILGLFIQGIICLIIPNLMFIAVFRKTEEFQMVTESLKKVVSRK